MTTWQVIDAAWKIASPLVGLVGVWVGARLAGRQKRQDTLRTFKSDDLKQAATVYHALSLQLKEATRFATQAIWYAEQMSPGEPHAARARLTETREQINSAQDNFVKHLTTLELYFDDLPAVKIAGDLESVLFILETNLFTYSFDHDEAAIGRAKEMLELLSERSRLLHASWTMWKAKTERQIAGFKPALHSRIRAVVMIWWRRLRSRGAGSTETSAN